MPTATVTPSPTDEPTDTVTPSPTDAPIVAIVLTDTPEPTDTHTPEPSPTLTDAPTPTVTVTVTPTDQPSLTPTPTLTVTATTTATPTDAPPALIELGGDDGGVTGRAIPPELLIGGALLALIALYAALYLRGQIAGERYAGGFVIDHCPVCQRGKLNVETRSGRLLGIPNSRHIVRCDECRSILREVGGRRWRYAVDSLEDQAMYRAYNGKVLTERQIVALDDALARPKNARRGEGSPAFVEDDTED
ncbi:MAG: hypothetical protein EA396_04820 [Anaerolineaceae bacterium]|nr:MAG: hypothetical protein EA396_04820 [Anaerolineaceae bacterium]